MAASGGGRLCCCFGWGAGWRWCGYSAPCLALLRAQHCCEIECRHLFAVDRLMARRSDAQSFNADVGIQRCYDALQKDASRVRPDKAFGEI